MTDDQHGGGTPPGGSRWDPLPQGDYDDGATAFVNLPEGGIDALLDSMESPLAAPGHGYVPPQITVTPATTAGTDPAATGTWSVPGAPADGARWHDPQAGEAEEAADRFTYDPGATGQWTFEEPSAENPAPGQDVTGQWSIPVAGGDLPDESGEFTTSSLVEQWGGGTPPATLPGGAAAPWATTESIGRPWGPGVPGVPQDAGESGQHDGGPGPRPSAEYGSRQPGEYGGQPSGEYGGQSAQEAPERASHDEPGQRVHDASGQPAHDALRPAGPPEPGRPSPGEPGPDGTHAAHHAPFPGEYGGQPSHDAPGQPAHGGPRSEGVPQPLPADGGPEPRWRTGAEAAGGAPADGREHPHPGPQDASEPFPEPAAAPEAPADAHGPHDASHDATGDPADPVAAPAGTPDPAAHPEDASAAPGDPDEADGAPDITVAPHDDHPLASYVLRVNGTDRPVSDAWIGESLLYVLRERLGLAGAKDGCSQGECGACNVQVDGRLVASCLVPAVTAAGSEVRTVEGLAQDGRPSDVQRALARCGAVQCGFCVPGMAMTVHDLLEGNPAPTELETRQALCGNLCRCSGYRGVVDAVKEVVAEREAHADSSATDPDGEPDTPRIPHQAGPGAGGVHPSAFGGPAPHEHPQEPPHDRPYGQDGGQA
ncbi:2Fe-2S iron-sulfur cluster-binding protein [Streptomyces sp. enrichment culture]|uniref:(2Fe-2S)-binding protein n=1 Tax=Streptomyces sp. enrichment culture TaxID=1795815 RepID=UPI003F57DF02